MLEPKAEQLVRKLISDYYFNADSIAPQHTERREFGFGDFEKKIAFRHYSFRNDNDFKKYIVDNAPPFINYSPAEYEHPDGRPMENKGWLGGELIFDLDATDLRLPCQEKHGRSWVCENCLAGVKEETTKLVEDFLIPDFGFSEKEIKINFSGNRGYHVHVVNDAVFHLNSKARRQISEYITGSGINPEKLFELRPVKREGMRSFDVLHGPKPTDGGWGGKIARNLIGALNTGVATLEEMGIRQEYARKLFKNRATVVLGISTGNWDTVKIPKKEEFWKDVIKTMAIKQSDSIDRNVTNDTGHLIRLPDSLHGDTGLLGNTIPSLGALQKFDPMKDSVVFKGKALKVRIEKAPKFSINGEDYGPYEKATAELPLYAAVYLILKRAAQLLS
ncbi:MAG: DNA primase catalytic subunit PriS [Candidatus Micrarchaeales archaeon]|nr:DNA primase catalytic subunit PriS [Candidatus Micrarchaeales archaeon]